jgi:hypothetical protein
MTTALELSSLGPERSLEESWIQRRKFAVGLSAVSVLARSRALPLRPPLALPVKRLPSATWVLTHSVLLRMPPMPLASRIQTGQKRLLTRSIGNSAT